MLNFEEYEIPMEYEITHDRKFMEYDGKLDQSPRNQERKR